MLKNKIIHASAVKESFLKPIMASWLGLLCFLVAVSFFLQTYDSACVKISLFYCGIAGLTGLWVSGLIKERANIFTKNNFILFLPFILYFLYTVLSFFFTPYPLVRWESLLRFVFSSLLFLIIVFEYEENLIYKLISWIILSCWFVYGYGLLQIVNNYLLPGADPLFWTDFFGKRVFSTIANPNFFGDFCLFTLILIAARYLLTKQKSLLILAAAGLLNIFFTESKGAWAALAVSLIAFAFVYLNYFVDVYKKHRLKFNAFALVIIFAASLAVGVFAVKRMQSVNFRLSTWRATWDMIAAKPLTGTGIGSFENIYPAYKRPEIFYMENLHNAQTQHAENYYLETWAERGIFGFGLFILCCFYLLKAVFAKFKDFKNEAPAEREKLYTLLGCFAASAAVYIHNFVDVSLYFVSTGLFVTVFNASAVNLALGRGERILLPQTEKKDKKEIVGFTVYIFAIFAACLFFAFAFLASSDFNFMTQLLINTRPFIFFVCWAFFLFCAFGAAGVLAYAAFKAKNIRVSIVLAVCACVMYFGWGFMRADNFLAIAGKLAEANDISAVQYYTRILKINPFDAESYMHRGMLFSNRLELTPSNNPFYGDESGKLFDDYQRALRDYEQSLKIAPYSVLIYYNLGALQRNTALKISQMPQYADMPELKEQVKTLYAQAQKNLKHALLTDPVYDNIYYQLANVSFDNGDFKTAYFWLLKYTQGPAGVVNQEYLLRHKTDAKALQYIKYAQARLTQKEIEQIQAEAL